MYIYIYIRQKFIFDYPLVTIDREIFHLELELHCGFNYILFFNNFRLEGSQFGSQIEKNNNNKK